jgi:hypothetical protein
MSATVMKTGEVPAASAVVDPAEPHGSPKYYRGFVAGVFSGIAKLSGMFIFQEQTTLANEDSWPSLRYHQSPPTNYRQVTVSRTSRLSVTDTEEGGRYRTVQGRNTTIGRMDVHGLGVRLCDPWLRT